MAGIGLLAAPAAHTEDAPVTVTVNGNDIRSDNVNGLPFKGFGTLSCNSTSNLLMDYKAEHPEQYWQLIRMMFGGKNPMINHVKIEMGSDTNTSTGADPASMRTPDELADASRSPGFQLAADAKTVNPGLKVSILRWVMPEWVQKEWDKGTDTGNAAVYKWYKETILDAWQKYGYMVDYVDPDTNETTVPNTSFVTWYKNAILADTDFSDPRYGIPADKRDGVEKAYKKIKIIASDENTTMKIGPAVLSDADLFAAVDAVGYHYTTEDRHDGAADSVTNQPYTKLATGQNPFSQDKEVWYSEGTGSFGYTDYRVNNTEGPNGASTGIGGLQSALDIANRVVKGYANSKRTHYIFQPGIGSFYEGAQYSHKELVSARDPWSGYIHYDAAIYVMQQFSRFAKTGWENSTNTAGIWRTVPEASYSGVNGTENLDGSNGAPSFMTLADPQRRDFSTVAVNDSDQLKTYRIKAENMRLADPTMEVWETRGADPGQAYDANFQHLAATVEPDGDGYYNYTVKPRSIVTFTTLDKRHDKSMARLPRSVDRAVLDTDAAGKRRDTRDDTLYADNFEYKEEGRVQVGTGDGAHKATQPYLVSRGYQPRYMDDETGAWEVGQNARGNHVLYQSMDQSMKDTRAWNASTPNTTVGDFRWENYKASVDVTFPDPAGGLASLGVRQQSGMTAADAAYGISINRDGTWTFSEYGNAIATGTVPAADSYHLAVEAKGATITAFVNGRAVHVYQDPTPEAAGRVKLGTDFHRTGFDNLKVERVDGYTPYADDQLDNMDSRVSYTGKWSRNSANGSYNDWYRTTSTSTQAGASFTVPFTGTGIDLIGGNDGTAVMNVQVDGRPVARNAKIAATAQRLEAYTLRGLPQGRHTATFELASGKLVLDALNVMSGDIEGTVDTAPIRASLQDVGTPNQADYTADSWRLFTDAHAAATSALHGQRGLDTIGAAQIASRLEAAYDQLVRTDVTTEQEDLGLAGAVTTTGSLPATMTIDGRSHAVTWTRSSLEATRTAYGTLSVAGWTNDDYVDGKKQAFTGRFEVVPPSLVYYVDSGVPAGRTSTQFDAVSHAGQLKNAVADQVSPSADAWGYLADGANIKAGTDPADKYSTGLWASSNKALSYRLPLDAGTYVLTAGFKEWWGVNRPMTQSVTFADQTVEGGTVTLTPASTATGTVEFTLGQAATVTYTVTKAAGADPVISWLGVARTSASASAH